MSGSLSRSKGVHVAYLTGSAGWSQLLSPIFPIFPIILVATFEKSPSMFSLLSYAPAEFYVLFCMPSFTMQHTLHTYLSAKFLTGHWLVRTGFKVTSSAERTVIMRLPSVTVSLLSAASSAAHRGWWSDILMSAY
ncbi:hypothetical protein F4806DRAFT_215099 [Annulohypoxylon nitens]|nr:hypothetical protein F4806DRAFT_215099 [Annulohypoxylon nitens]